MQRIQPGRASLLESMSVLTALLSIATLACIFHLCGRLKPADDSSSTQLDSWTWYQLHVMKVGGNQRAHEFFKQHFGWKDDPKQRYTSRAALNYKDKITVWADKDAAEYF